MKLYLKSIGYYKHNSAMGNLTEGIVDFIKKTATKVKTYVADFFKRVIKAIVNKLKEWASAGLEMFAKLLGWELDANCSIGRMP